MVREILLWPDKRLQSRCADVTAFDASLEQLSKDLLDTCLANNGAGLAAPQIGVLQRVLVVLDQVFVNPMVVTFNGEKTPMAEGCLSFPGVSGRVLRRPVVTVEYQDIKGISHTQELTGYLAHVVQHECDHLEGIVMPDHMTAAQRGRLLRSYSGVRRRVV